MKIAASVAALALTLVASCGPSDPARTAVSTPPEAEAQATAPAVEPSPPKPDLSSLGIGPNGEGAYVYKPWFDKIQAGQTLGELSPAASLAALQYHTLLARFAPPEFFEQPGMRAHFASLLDCDTYRAEATDEFALRDTVEKRLATIGALLRELPDDPVMKARGHATVSAYDFGVGQFRVSRPSIDEGFPVTLRETQGKWYNLPDLDRVTHIEWLAIPSAGCSNVPFAGSMDRYLYSSSSALKIPVKMTPWYLKNFPETLKMNEADAAVFARSLGPDRRLTWDLEFRPAGRGFRAYEGATNPCDNEHFCYYGSFLLLDVTWTLTTQDGTVIAQWPDKPPAQ